MKNKGGSVAMIAIIIVIVAITAGVVGWMFAKKSQAPLQRLASSTDQKNNEQVVTESNQNQSQDIVYSNSSYGFSLNFPQSWKDFKVTDGKEETTGIRITFSHPVARCSFPILLSKIKEWDDCKSQKDPNAFYWCGKELGRNEKYVFHPANSAPDCENANLVIEASGITDTFKLTNDGAAVWQTYQNEKYGFELKIPQDMKVGDAGDAISIGYAGYQKNLPEGGRNMFISSKKISLENFINEYEQKDPGINKITKQEDIQVGQLAARKLTGTTAIGISTNFALIRKNDGSYIIIEFSDSNDAQKKILNTFKFID